MDWDVDPTSYLNVHSVRLGERKNPKQYTSNQKHGRRRRRRRRRRCAVAHKYNNTSFSSFSSLQSTPRQGNNVLGREEKLIDTEEKCPAETKNARQAKKHSAGQKKITHDSRDKKCQQKRKESAIALCISEKHCSCGPLLKKFIVVIFSIGTGSLLQYTISGTQPPN